MENLTFDNDELKQVTWEDFIPFEEQVKSKRWYTDYIDNLDCNADIKNALKAILDITQKCGEMILHIGKIVMHIAVSVAQKYPNTITGAILGLAIAILVKSSLILGFLLAPLNPLFVAVPAFMGFLADIGGVQQIKNSIVDVLTRR